jgi:hypothetical protein
VLSAKCSAGFRAAASFWARGPLETQGGNLDAKVPCVGRWHTVAEARNPGPGSAPLDLAEVASVSELLHLESVVNGGKQRALFGWLEANFPGTKVLGTHGPHDAAAPEGKPARHARVEPDGRDARRIMIGAGPWGTGLLRLHPGLLNEGGVARTSWMGRTRDARKEDAILGQAGWPAEPASRAGGATGYSGRENMLGIYIDGPSRAARYLRRAPRPGCPCPRGIDFSELNLIRQRIKFESELVHGGFTSTVKAIGTVRAAAGRHAAYGLGLVVAAGKHADVARQAPKRQALLRVPGVLGAVVTQGRGAWASRARGRWRGRLGGFGGP